VPLASAGLVERLSQRRDMDLNGVFFDDGPWPHPIHQLIFTDDLALGRREYAKNFKRAAAERHWRPVPRQRALAKIEPEPANADVTSIHRSNRRCRRIQDTSGLNQGHYASSELRSSVVTDSYIY
jgi:hypothetical protein